jgi:hypothetical protein
MLSPNDCILLLLDFAECLRFPSHHLCPADEVVLVKALELVVADGNPPDTELALARFREGHCVHWTEQISETCRARSTSCAANTVDDALPRTSRRTLSRSRTRHRRPRLPARPFSATKSTVAL